MLRGSGYFSANGILFVESLPEHERHTGRWVADSLAVELSVVHRVWHEHRTVVDGAGLFNEIVRLRERVRRGKVFPILQIDSHGDESGLILAPSGEVVSWKRLCEWLRPLNEATANNLTVVVAACHGFRGIVGVSVSDTTPFFQLIGPPDVILPATFQEALPTFYRTLLTGEDMRDAFATLPSTFQHYQCERMFIRGFADYVLQNCRGRGKQERIEYLMTKLRQAHPTVPLKGARQRARDMIRPNIEGWNLLRDRFLMTDLPENSDRFTVSFDAFMREIETGTDETVARYRARHISAPS